MRVLVTGATGFIGFHTARALRERGHAVRALARDRDKAARLLAPLAIDAADIATGDMTDPAAVTRALAGCQAVVHAAAAVSVTVVGGADAFAANAVGAQCVAGEAAGRGLSPILFVSSLAAIFDPRAPALDPALPLVESATRYGQSKVESDRRVRALQDAGAPIQIVYPSGVIGPDDPGRSESMRAHATFATRTIRAGGTQFVDVRDLAALHVALLERGSPERVVAAGHYFTWDALADLYEEVSGGQVERIGLPGWLLRLLARGADAVARRSRRSFGTFTRESLEIATRWRRIPDSPLVADLGVTWRDPRETVEAVLRWGLANGRVKAAAAPRLSARAR